VPRATEQLLDVSVNIVSQKLLAGMDGPIAHLQLIHEHEASDGKQFCNFLLTAKDHHGTLMQ